MGIYFHDQVVRDHTDSSAYLSLEFSGKPVRYIVLDRDVQHGRVNDGWLDDRRMLHLEERFDRFYLRFVWVIRQRAPFGRQSTSSHPFGVLLLLYNMCMEGWKKVNNHSYVTLFNLVQTLTLSHLIHISVMPSELGTSSFIPNLFCEMFTSGVTSHPLRLTLCTGSAPTSASSTVLYILKCKSRHVNQYRLNAFSVNFLGL